MNEYINRDELKEALLRRGFYPVFVKAALESLPAIDIVTCKDCKYYKDYEPPIEDFDGFCAANENEYDREFYCQYGEKRDSDVEIH